MGWFIGNTNLLYPQHTDMLHLMRRALADMVAVGQDDRPAAGGDVDMADEGAAVP